MSRLAFALLLAFSFSLSAHGQTVVQLPSMHTFSVQTSVLVPDSGGATLGAIRRAAHARNARGAPGWGPLGRNVAGAGAAMSTGVSVHATIIDHAELDALVLEEARATREAMGKELIEDRPRVKPPRETGPIESVASIKRRLAAEDAEMEAQAERDFEKAMRCEQEGQLSLARSYYRIAAKKSTGDVKQRAMERVAALPSPPKSKNK